ncbi:MAG: thiamine pyrophosphate-dependent enzyme [Planctomycetota bacterium]
MSLTRVEIAEQNLDHYLASAAAAATLLADDAPLVPGARLTARAAIELFEDMVLSRTLDVAARSLKKHNKSFYTIGSSGHEMNACVGRLLRIDDPCFLHYRSGALMMARSRQLAGSTPTFDTLLSLTASAEDPISHGRHKVWGSRPLWVPPQTSTIASHVPKAVGLAFALGRARRLELATGLPDDAIVLCSFGDASANHATALAGFNAARYSARMRQPMPILFLCEDNGIGISVPTPRGWLADSFGGRGDLHYVCADGELDDVHERVHDAIAHCRTRRAPVFLHLQCVRLFGHAGTDVETGYRTVAQIEASEASDPLLRTARRLLASGAATPAMLRALIADTRCARGGCGRGSRVAVQARITSR